MKTRNMQIEGLRGVAIWKLQNPKLNLYRDFVYWQCFAYICFAVQNIANCPHFYRRNPIVLLFGQLTHMFFYSVLSVNFIFLDEISDTYIYSNGGDNNVDIRLTEKNPNSYYKKGTEKV